jgi:hypothetical protein
MSRIVRWETPFTDSFYPSVLLLAIPFPLLVKKGISAKLIVAPDGIDKYPKYLVDFDEVLAFTCMEESCCPERDISSAIIDETIKNDKSICAFQWIDSPWLQSYEGCYDPFSEGKFSHYLIYGGDNNIEVITKNAPLITKIEQKEILKFDCEI